MNDSATAPHLQRELLGHPAGLFVLFATEMWERFSYYGMRALLVLYLVKYHLFTDAEAAHTYAAYAALVYCLPVIGGVLADRYLGFRKAVVFGGLLLVAGHTAMAFEGDSAVRDAMGVVTRDSFGINAMFTALALICVGVGFLKPNISGMVGELYPPGDGRRDGGFTIFYMGINLGAAAASLFVGWLGETVGWSWGFGAAGIGMLLGLLTFLWGQKYLKGLAEPTNPEKLAEVHLGLKFEHWIYAISLISVVAIHWLLQRHQIVGGGVLLTFVAVYVFWIYHCFARAEPQERNHIILVILLTLFSVLFWALFEQAPTSLNLFADRITDRMVMGYEITAGQIQSLNAIFILMLAPVFAMLWTWFERRNIHLSYATKFGLAIVQAGLGFLVLVLGMSLTDPGVKVALIWLVLVYLFHTTGELCLSPVGLSMVTKLTPFKLVGTMMGTWFLASAGAEYVSGVLAALASIETPDGETVDLVNASTIYGEFFGSLGWLGAGIGVLILAFVPLLRKLQAQPGSGTPTGEDEEKAGKTGA